MNPCDSDPLPLPLSANGPTMSGCHTAERPTGLLREGSGVRHEALRPNGRSLVTPADPRAGVNGGRLKCVRDSVP
jgi:hypothetical protein